VTILQADARDMPLADKSMHCCVTSPPFFGLRDYGLPPSHWPAMTYVPMSGAAPISIDAMVCCLGLEKTVAAYVGHLVYVGREMWRVLRDDGTLWLNLGDSYAGSGKGHVKHGTLEGYKQKTNKGSLTGATAIVTDGLKPKDLVGIPWRVAFALQADGWYLRSDIIWHKPNPMPESVRDRPTKAHEYIFLLSKSKRYFYDGEAVKEPSTMHSADWNEDGTQKRQSFKRGHGNAKNSDPGKEPFRAIAATRNRRTVWTISTKPYKGAHFATFPPALIEPCIKAGTSERGCCPECGAPWERCNRSRNVVYSGHENKTVQSMPQGQTGGSVLPSESQDLQDLRSQEKKSAPTRQSRTRTGDSEIIPRDTSRRSRGTPAPLSGDGTWQRDNVSKRAQIPTYREGQGTIKSTGGSVEQNGEGAIEWPDPLCPEKSVVAERAGDIHGTGLGTDIRETAAPLQLLRGAIHKEPTGDHRSCDALIKRRDAQSRKHSSGVSVVQLKERSQPVDQVTTTGWRPTCGCNERGADLKPDDLDVIASPTGERAGDDSSLETGRAGYNRPRGDAEGRRKITRYEQRQYAKQIKASPHRDAMTSEAGDAFAHYIRTDRSGGRPVPEDLLEAWLGKGWLKRVDPPNYQPYEPVPCIVLDPFGGAGTTKLEAERLGRRAVVCELKGEYCQMARDRTKVDLPLFDFQEAAL